MSLTITVPVWPGSSSFAPGLTQFGFFDTDTIFSGSADKVASWCATRLGYPFNDIELQNIHFYACFEEAVLEYSNQVNQFQIRDNLFILQGAATGVNLTGRPVNPTLNRLVSISKNYGTEAGSGGNIIWKTASIDVKEGQQVYNLNAFTYESSSDASKSIEIKRVFHDTPPAIVRYFDPFIGTGLGSQTLLENFGWGNYSPGVSFLMMPVYADLLRLQAIEFNDMIRKSGFSWEVSGERIKIFPVPTYDYKLYIEYITVEERAAENLSFANTNTIGDFSNAPYQLHTYSAINPAGRQWVYKYTLALAKEVLGNIRNKYSTVPIPGSEITLNGADLVSQGQTEKTDLIAQLRENLEAVSRSAQMTKMNTEAEDMQSQLNKIPMKIYIG
jgi:hypothetical protein